MLDELMDSSFSAENVDMFLDFLKTLSIDKEIMVVSHRNLDTEMFNNIYSINKINNFTNIRKVE